MIIITITSYPTESATEIGKRFVNFPPLPDFVTMKGPFVSSVIDEGIKGITIYEFDESRYGEVYRIITDRISKFLGVPGFTYSVNHWMEAKDALALVGLE